MILAGAFLTLLTARPLRAQMKETKLSDGVIKYEVSGTNPPPDSFWQIFQNLFQFAPKKPPFEKNFAFLVGVSSYKFLDPQLPYVKTDLENLRTFLMSQAGFDVVYIAADDVATAGLVENYMLNRFSKEIGENDRLFFYYSGHGADIGGSTGYMQFSKARKGFYEVDQYLAITRTQEWSKIIKAKHVLFFLDSCASGLGFDAKSGASSVDQDLLSTLSGNGSRFVITAGTAREKAFQVEVSSNNGYSVFTRSFLDALQSNSNGYAEKGFLVLDEVFADAKVRVGRFESASGQKMTPRLWPIPRDSKDTGTFIFINKDVKNASLSNVVRAKFDLAPKNTTDASTGRYTPFLSREVGQIGADLSDDTRKSVARALLETELTWSYGSRDPEPGKGALFAGDEFRFPGSPTTDKYDNTARLSKWMTHLVNSLKSAGFTMPLDTNEWSASDIDKNKKLLAYMYELVLQEKWSHPSGISKLRELLPNGQPLIVKEVLDISNREDYNHGLWRLQLELGELLEEAPDIDMTLRAYGTVIKWNDLSTTSTIVTELLKYAGKITHKAEFEDWFSSFAEMPYSEFVKQTADRRKEIEERMNTASQNPSQKSPQVAQSPRPTTFLDRVVQENRGLTPDDRNRLSTEFYECDQFIRQSQAVGYKLNEEFGKLSNDRQSGALAKNVDDHIKFLRDLDTSAWDQFHGLQHFQAKWQYFPDQTEYVFGDNPFNAGEALLINAAEGMANALTSWSKISNRDQKEILNIEAQQQVDFEKNLRQFFDWANVSLQRVRQTRQSLDPNGVVQPLPTNAVAPATGMFSLNWPNARLSTPCGYSCNWATKAKNSA
jgi:hypothetical protein